RRSHGHGRRRRRAEEPHVAAAQGRQRRRTDCRRHEDRDRPARVSKLMNGTRVLLLLPVLAIACQKAPEPQQKPAAPAGPMKFLDDKGERPTLLTGPRGRLGVARSGEWTPGTSAVALIAPAPGSAWLSPPADPLQAITTALAARTRIEQVGIHSKNGLTP